MIRILFCILFIGFSFSGLAQFRMASIRIDGLTCSMCSNSVEKSIRKLDFVEDVQMNLNTTIADVTFVADKKVNIGQLAAAVKDAGFSVGYLNAAFYFDSLSVSEGVIFEYENSFYRFVSSEQKMISGLVTLKFLGKNFQEKKEYLNSVPLYSAYLKEDKKKNVYYIQL